MTVLHSGTNTKYSTNWEKAFGKGKPAAAAAAKPDSKKAAAKKPKSGKS